MCRGVQQSKQSERLKIKAFYVQLSVTCSKNNTHLPDYLTLHYLPRVNASQLEINGSKIRPDSPAFVTLHRVWSNDHCGNGSILYGCRDRVVVCEGVRFEVYVGDVKVLKGIFRKDEEGQNWKMGCKCHDVLDGVKDAEVSVAVEGPVAAVNERVKMVARGGGGGGCFVSWRIFRRRGRRDRMCVGAASVVGMMRKRTVEMRWRWMA